MSDCLDLMKRTLKLISDEDVEIFLYFNIDIATQIVNDLIDEPNSNLNSYNMNTINNVIDRETK